MTQEIVKHEDLGLVTIKVHDSKEFLFRFIKWDRREEFEHAVNTQKVFKIADETFPIRNFEKLEKFNGEYPDPRVLELVGQKIRKYRSTFFCSPPEKQIQIMMKNAKEELNLKK